MPVDILAACGLCPRRLFQAGKAHSNFITLLKTPCDHCFHPACWERHYKKAKVDSASCPCPKCHRAVQRHATTEISVFRDTSLLREEEDGRSPNPVCSAVEQARLRQAAAELEKRSQPKMTPKKTRPPKPVRPRSTSLQTTSSGGGSSGFWRCCTKFLGITFLVLAILVLLGKCYWDHVVIGRLDNWDDVMTDKINILGRLAYLNEHGKLLENLTAQGKNLEAEIVAHNREVKILEIRLYQRNKEIQRLEMQGKDTWSSEEKLEQVHAQMAAIKKMFH